MPDLYIDMTDGISAAMKICHGASRKAGWWTDLATGQPLVRNRPEMMMLMVSEIAEAMEGYRKQKMDEHLPYFTSETVEMADLFIRLMDYCGGHGLDLVGAVSAKLEYNARRADHKLENRAKLDGKKF